MSIAPPRSRHLRNGISIRWVLTVPFVLSTVGVAALIGYLSYRSGQATVEDLGHQLVEQTNERVAQELKAYLQTPILLNRLNVDTVNQGQLDLQNIPALESALFQRLQQFESVSAVLFVSPEGRLRFIERFPDLYLGVADPPRPDFIQIYSLDRQGNRGKRVNGVNGLDVRRDRPFYQRAVTTGQPGWSAMTRYGNSPALTLNASQPVYDGKTRQLLGVFGVHLQLDYLSDFLHRLEASRVGQVLILDQDSRLIATSTQEKPYTTGDEIKQPNQFRQLKIDESQNDLTRSLGIYLRNHPTLWSNSTHPQSMEFRHRGESYYVRITPFQDRYGLNWRILNAIPRSHFMEAIEHNSRTTILLSLLTLGGTLTLGLFAANKFTERFAALERVSQALAVGNLDQRLPTNTLIAEINHLSQTFNQMAEQLQQSFDRMTLSMSESEEKFTTIFRTSPDPMAIATLAEGRLLVVNDSMAELFGYSHAEMVGRTPLDLNLWHDPDELARYRTLLEQQGSVCNLEVRSQTKSGAVKTALISSEVRTLEGQSCVIVMLRDISDRKATELALQESEARYRAIVENQTEIICRALSDTTLIFVNDTYCHFYGVRREDILGQPFLPMIYPEDQEKVLQVIRSTSKANPTVTMENRVLVQGQIRWMQWIDRVSFDEQGNIIEIQSVGRDITELKQTEAALRTSEANLLQAQAIARLGSWEFDLATEEITASEELVHIFGLDPFLANSSYNDLLERVVEEDRERLEVAIQTAIADTGAYEVEHRICRPDGTVRHVVSRGQTVFNAQNDIVKLIGTCLDITERKRAEDALRQSEALNRAILNAIPDMIIRMHRDGTYLDIKQAKDFPSRLPNLSLRRNVRDVLPLEDAQRRLEAAAIALKTGEVQVYEFSLWVQGQFLWQEVRVIPLNLDEVLVLLRDLTQRRRMEEALRQSETRLALAQQVAQLGYWENDLTTGIRTWSEMTFRHWGLEPDEHPPRFEELLERVHPHDRVLWQKAAEKASMKGVSHSLDLRITLPDGSIRYLETRAEPMFDTQRNLVKLIGTSLDITERKQTEQALQEREAMLRAIGDNLPKGFIYQRMYDPAKGFYYSYVSAGIEKLLGLKPEAVLKDSTITRTVGFEEDLGRADQIARESLQNLTPIELQMRSRKPDGSVRWSAIRSSPRRLEDGRTVWDGVEVDITDLKQTEAALRASEEEFRRAFDDAPIGMSLVSPAGQFVRVNTCYCNLLEYTEAELLQLNFRDITHPGDVEKDQSGFQQMISGELQTFQMEKRYITKHGQIVPVLLNTALIRDQEGHPAYIIGHVQDIRDRRKVERMKNEFISTISHELRTPLTSIRGALGILCSGVYNDRPEKASHMLNIAKNNSDRLVRLVNDILDLERLESGKVKLVMQPCQVADLMQQAIDGVQAIADQSNVTLSVTTLPITVWASPDAIIQALTNLLSNAIKFSSPGSTVWLKADLLPHPSDTHPSAVRTSAEALIIPADAHPPIHPSTHPPIPSLRFSIIDHGRGIPEDKLELIFEQFQQVDASDSRRKGGTGLGLAICRNIVQQHGGQIWVESRLGEGSTFYFTLPLKQTEI
jgi:PAS domain S-box-containing protein